MPINSIKEHLRSVSPNCKIDPTCHSTAKRSGSSSTVWFRLLPARKHTQRSLRCCSHAKTIFPKCLKELRDCYLKTKQKHLKHRALHFRRIATAARVTQAGSGSMRSTGHGMRCCWCLWGNFSSQKDFWSQRTKQIPCTLSHPSTVKSRGKELSSDILLELA